MGNETPLAAPAGARKKTPLRVLFLADLGPIPARVIWAWQDSGHEIAEIWTGGAARRGAWKRDRRLGWFARRWSVSAAISKEKIRHRHIEHLKPHSEFAELISSLAVDAVISVHFMLILPRELLSQLPMAVINVHPSLLPAYRGPNPMVAMILDETQDRFGGVTLHQIVPSIDAGPIFASRSVPFPKNGSFRRWELDLACAAASLAVQATPEIVAGRLIGVEQAERDACYRRATEEELKLTQTLTSKRIAWLCSTIGRVRGLQFVISNREFAVTGISRHLGRPSGQPPRISWWTIETDVADARLRLRRSPRWEGRCRRIEAWLLRVLSPT